VDTQDVIVVGVDGSPESAAALRFALHDAVRRGALVRIVTAYMQPEYWAAAYGHTAPPTVEELVADHTAVVKDVIASVVADDPVLAPPGGDTALAAVPIDIVVVPGPPAKVLIEHSHGAVLLVLGHRGRGGFASAVLGSVGLHSVLHAACPVTIVRPAKQSATAPRMDDPGAAYAPTS
jgi:nucleotide-binding universal stress UspA family protein